MLIEVGILGRSVHTIKTQVL